MPFFVEQDEALDPIDISALRALRVMQQAHLGTDLIEQLRRPSFGRRRRWIRLALNRTVYDAVSDLKAVPFATAKIKYIEVAELFRKNGLEVRKSKTYIQILRALAAIGPSTATIVGRLVDKGAKALGNDQFRQLLQPFFKDLDASARVLAME